MHELVLHTAQWKYHWPKQSKTGGAPPILKYSKSDCLLNSHISHTPLALYASGACPIETGILKNFYVKSVFLNKLIIPKYYPSCLNQRQHKRGLNEHTFKGNMFYYIIDYFMFSFHINFNGYKK